MFITTHIIVLVAVFCVALIALVVTLMCRKLQHTSVSWLTKWFFNDRYMYAEALHDLSELLNKTLSSREIVEKSFETLRRILKTKTVSFAFFPGVQQTGRQIEAHHLGDSCGTSLYSDCITNGLKTNHDVITHEGLHALAKAGMMGAGDQNYLNELHHYFDEDGIEVLVPIVLEDRVIGVFALGKKVSGGSYTATDLRLLKTFSYQVAVALDKARHYEKAKCRVHGLEGQVKQRTADIQMLHKERERMFAQIAHGLQTPLTELTNDLTLWTRQASGDTKIETLRESIDTVSQYIYDLLHLVRLERVPVNSCQKRLDMSQLLCDLVERLEVIAEEKQITIRSDIEPDVIVVGCEDQLRELATNLASNAVKYIQKDEAEEGQPDRAERDKWIHITLRTAGQVVIATVEDSGIGIDKKEVAHIFEPFYRAENHGIAPGTGLGLSICKEIIKRHRGTITVESDPGMGTIFTITLPAAT